MLCSSHLPKQVHQVPKSLCQLSFHPQRIDAVQISHVLQPGVGAQECSITKRQLWPNTFKGWGRESSCSTCSCVVRQRTRVCVSSNPHTSAHKKSKIALVPAIITCIRHNRGVQRFLPTLVMSALACHHHMDQAKATPPRPPPPHTCHDRNVCMRGTVWARHCRLEFMKHVFPRLDSPASPASLPYA